MPLGAQKIVVTGGAGFIGSHLVDRLLKDEHSDVVVFDNLSRGSLANLRQHADHPSLQFIEGDVADAEAVRAAIRGARYVFHLAAQSSVFGAVQGAEITFNSNVIGTYNVLRAASLHGVQRVLFASSRQVYGEPISLPVDEDSPLLAINSYGASKVAGEAYCRAFRREFGLQVDILRLSNVYGPRDVDRVIPQWIFQALTGRKLIVFGGKQVIDLVWIDQVVEALVRAAAREGPLPPMNIGSGTGTRIVDLARRIARLATGQPHITFQPARPMEVTRFVANIDRMRQMLDIEPPLDPLNYLPALMPATVGTTG
jgi:nucleoside-diphosphate-sugar epimerase